ncbi:hypothetical protein GALMADRAFT_78787 [Galerina marginata CBS 339.88]|uniref:Terpene synthase n=1 Tax=Galerina marginata (strain CBS 339.88) TaxID=685588 RepID=A0A067SN56_GALM3|nr:hypothetical protein GALMADRAFT_78787 [Galerina marginata CBS 339.88]
MDEFNFRPFPSTFTLKNLAEITSRAFPLKMSAHGDEVHETMRNWFMRYEFTVYDGATNLTPAHNFNVYDHSRALAYIDRGRFDVFAAYSFPDADKEHLETCLAFFYWAFSIDDRSDEGNLQARPDQVKAGLDMCRQVLLSPDSPIPDFPYAKMLHEMLAVPEFILERRATIGAALVEAMVEYSLDLNIPDSVFQDPIVIAMSEATTDIMTWPNDVCSFNKEQADGDFQNLVCCVMTERMVELQEAVNIVVDMLNSRVDRYITLKAQLRSFGPEVDSELEKYHAALEHFVQGTVVWYYLSPRALNFHPG